MYSYRYIVGQGCDHHYWEETSLNDICMSYVEFLF